MKIPENISKISEIIHKSAKQLRNIGTENKHHKVIRHWIQEQVPKQGFVWRFWSTKVCISWFRDFNVSPFIIFPFYSIYYQKRTPSVRFC